MKVAALLFIPFLSCATDSPFALRARQHAALQRGDTFASIQLGQARVRARPDDAAAHYDLACALARASDTSSALDELGRAVDLGFDIWGLMRDDPDLESLHGKPAFEVLVARSRQVMEEGLPLPTLETLARDDLPMPVRIRRAPGQRQRVAVWLHPSGAPSNAAIERLAPLFASQGFALVVPTGPPAEVWTDVALRTLLLDSVPELADVLDVERPLLVGFSAGGHAALHAWAATPEQFAGALVTAAGPQVPVRALPKTAVPVHVVVGSKDVVAADWPKLTPAWQAGRDVTVHVVEGAGHEFLLDEAEVRALLARVR